MRINGFYFDEFIRLKFPLHIYTLEIRNSSLNGVNVPDANLVSVTSTSEVVDLMNLGQRNRVVSATALNDRSSRSHRLDIFFFLVPFT